jgi:hypothetical protein
MQQIFAKRLWRFDPARWPIISFHVAGNRAGPIRASAHGDRIVFIGTGTAHMETSDRGRPLGVAEIGRIEIETADAVDIAKLRPNAVDSAAVAALPQEEVRRRDAEATLRQRGLTTS